MLTVSPPVVMEGGVENMKYCRRNGDGQERVGDRGVKEGLMPSGGGRYSSVWHTSFAVIHNNPSQLVAGEFIIGVWHFLVKHGSKDVIDGLVGILFLWKHVRRLSQDMKHRVDLRPQVVMPYCQGSRPTHMTEEGLPGHCY